MGGEPHSVAHGRPNDDTQRPRRVSSPRLASVRARSPACTRQAAGLIGRAARRIIEGLHRADTSSRLASGSTDCHNWLLLRPCRGGSNLRHVGLVEWDDVSSPFWVRRRDLLSHVTQQHLGAPRGLGPRDLPFDDKPGDRACRLEFIHQNWNQIRSGNRNGPQKVLATWVHCIKPRREQPDVLRRWNIGLAGILRHVVQFPSVVIHVDGLANGPGRQRRRRGGDPTIVVDGAVGEHLEVLSAVSRGPFASSNE